jgi:Protein of unknown function DUF45
MIETIELGEVSIAVTRKDIKNVHLAVHPPDGRVTMSAPKATRLEVARAYAISKLGWIREQRNKLEHQAREVPRQFIERESHYLWGRRYLMTVMHQDAKPNVTLDHKRIILTVRPGSDAAKTGLQSAAAPSQPDAFRRCRVAEVRGGAWEACRTVPNARVPSQNPGVGAAQGIVNGRVHRRGPGCGIARRLARPHAGGVCWG